MSDLSENPKYYPNTESAVLQFLSTIDGKKVTSTREFFGAANMIADAFTDLVNIALANQILNKKFPEVDEKSVARIKSSFQSSIGSSPQYSKHLEVAFKELKEAAQSRATVLYMDAQKNTDLPAH